MLKFNEFETILQSKMFKNHKEDRFLFIKKKRGFRLNYLLRNQERTNREIGPFLIIFLFRQHRRICWENSNVVSVSS